MALGLKAAMQNAFVARPRSSDADLRQGRNLTDASSTLSGTYLDAFPFAGPKSPSVL